MRTLTITFYWLLFISLNAFGQVAINTDDSDADASAALDIKSTVKGILVPNLSETERNAVPSPATGLFIYNRTVGYFNFYNGTNWIRIERTLVTDPATNPTGSGTDVGVGIGISDPDNSAILHVNSNNKGLLLPRPSSAISSPIAGSIYYNNGANNVYFHDGSGFTAVTNVTETAGASGSGTAEGVVIGGTSVDASAKLEIITTDKTMVIPRMTTTQRDAIDSPAEGLLVYNSTNNQPEYFVDSKWYTWQSAAIGSTSSAPGLSCLDVYNNNAASNGVDGLYWVDTDGSGANAPFQCYCDMTTDSGGWTLVVSFDVGGNSGSNTGDFFRNTTATRDPASGNVTTDVSVSSASWWSEMRWGPATTRSSDWSDVGSTRDIYNEKNTELLNWLAALGTGAAGFSPAAKFKCAFGDSYVTATAQTLKYTNTTFGTTGWQIPVMSTSSSAWSAYVPSMHLNTASNCVLSDTNGAAGVTCNGADSRDEFLQAWVR